MRLFDESISRFRDLQEGLKRLARLGQIKIKHAPGDPGDAFNPPETSAVSGTATTSRATHVAGNLYAGKPEANFRTAKSVIANRDFARPSDLRHGKYDITPGVKKTITSMDREAERKRTTY